MEFIHQEGPWPIKKRYGRQQPIRGLLWAIRKFRKVLALLKAREVSLSAHFQVYQLFRPNLDPFEKLIGCKCEVKPYTRNHTLGTTFAPRFGGDLKPIIA